MAEPKGGRAAPAPTVIGPQAVADYKRILQHVLDNRPSGMRQRLAEALGKNRSFISQICNPAYQTPVPAQHLERIFEICHFSPHEREEFLDAYHRAHPSRLRGHKVHARTRSITVDVPDLGDAERNAALDELIADFAAKTAKLLVKT
jgi:hypothetical protein